ncbi:MAG: GAF domain-containing protein [Chloroflexi bacterium]|nr:GAF domain-containing protein [Chloroflexota bacterium]
MSSIDAEADILYNALLRLTTSAKPLKAISDYAISLGAVRGLLIESQPEVRLVEEWAAPGLHSLGPDGSVLAGPPDDTTPMPVFISAMPPINGVAIHYESLARLPLVTAGMLIGWLVYLWDRPHDFSHDDRRILVALAEQSAPVFNLLWSLNSGQRKVIEMQMAKRESEILRSASHQLSQATDAVGLLEAVSAYPRMTGAAVGRLAYYDGDELRTVAMWQKGSPSHEVAGDPLELEAAVTGADDVILLDARYSTRAGSRAILHLNGRGAWMGTLVFDWEQTNFFNERDRYLYKALAQQISAVIDSIQLFEQINLRAQRAERRLRVNTALSTATDEVQILQALAEYPQIREAGYVVLCYLDADTMELTSVMPVACFQSGSAFYSQDSSYPASHYAINTLWLTSPDSVTLLEDIAQDERLTAAERNRLLTELKIQAAAIVPLFSNGRYQGVLHALWYEPHRFSDDEKYVFEEIRQSLPAFVASRRAFLEQEKARRETEQRAHELATVAQISAIISSILDEDLLLEKVAEVTRESFPDYRILIYLLVNNLLVRIPPQQKGSRPPSHTTYRLHLSQVDSLIAEAARTHQMQVVDDITAERRFKLQPLMPEARSELAIPMVMGDEVIGVVDVQAAETGRFSEPDARVLKTLVDMIAVAIQNARLYQQARQLAVAEERNRLARELHDSVSQALYGIVLGANTSQALLKAKQYDQLEGSVGYVLSLAKAGLDEIRASIFDLRPVVLQDQGLIKAITSQANALQIRHGIQVNVNLCVEPDLPFQIKEELYRIVREGLHNIVKHAQATQVNLSLADEDEEIRLLIEDNGVGFDPTRPSNSLGLKSMRERAASLRGTLTIDSSSGAGTRIAAVIPVRR